MKPLLLVGGLLLLQGQAPAQPGCVPAPASTTTAYGGAPTTHTVAVVGALIGPAMANGTPWDGPGNIGPLANEVSRALGELDPRAAVLAVLAGPSVRAFEPPDTGGRVELYIDGAMIAVQELYKRQNELAPQWNSPPVQFMNVDVSRARLRVVLIDRDLAADDDIGTVDIDSGSLMQAASNGGHFSFRAAEQTHNQVLFIDLAVM